MENNLLSFEEYTEEVRYRLSEELEDRKIEVTNMLKNNGISLTGLQISYQIEENIIVGATFYLDDMYEEYLNGELDVDEAAEILTRSYRANNPADFKYDLDFSLEHVKNRIICSLVNKELNMEKFENAVTIDFLDLTVVLRIIDNVNLSRQGMNTLLVSPKMLREWGKTKEEILSIAKENTKKIFSVSCRPILEFLKERYEIIDIPEPCPFLILSNKVYSYGATLMLYKEELRKIADELDTDLYILPSSIHELILVPIEEDTNLENLKELVAFVNANEVPKSELLSESVYFFDRESEEVKIV